MAMIKVSFPVLLVIYFKMVGSDETLLTFLSQKQNVLALVYIYIIGTNILNFLHSSYLFPIQVFKE
jgi:hypothetical protein